MSELEPYARLIGSLLPRAEGVCLFNADGQLHWSCQGSAAPELSQAVSLLLGASTDSGEVGERLLLNGQWPVYLLWIRSDAGGRVAVLAITWRVGEAEQPTLASVHERVKPALEILRRELLARERVESLRSSIRDRDRDLDVLMLATATPEDNEGGDVLKGLLQQASTRLLCEFSALIVPERNLVMISAAEGRKADTSVVTRIHRQLLSLAQLRGEPIILNRDGELPGMLLSWRVLSCPVRNRSGRPCGILAMFRDLSQPEFRERDAQLADRLAQRAAVIVEASFDSLSGLLTRPNFEQRVRAALAARPPRRDAPWSAVYLDTDRMHIINDNYGMHVGDRLIGKLGEMIRSRLVPGALAARLSGDRFVILLPSSAEDAMAFAESLRQSVAMLLPAQFGADADAGFSASVSVGVAAIDEGSMDFPHALAAAEAACKAAKDRGRNRVEACQPGDTSIVKRYEDMNLVPGLRAAIVEGRLRLESQLIVPLDVSQHTIPYFELLLRMVDENGQTLSPGRFLSAAVRYQLMPEVDRWVVQTAVEQLRPFARLLADRPAMFTINLSGQSLGEADFPDFLVGLIKDSGLNPKIFCFEITETAAIANLPRAEALMRRLRAMGCSFALDDFGTGLSSLAYLRSLPVDILKIDGSFVRDILKDPRAESLVQTIAHLSRSMNLITVAEYVETDEIRLRVAALGVDYGQGFAIAPPVPLAETIASLEMISSVRVVPVAGKSEEPEIVLSDDPIDFDDFDLGPNDDTLERLPPILRVG
ncbi:MAG: bifunctional diguanylate cyclase/phosphodiesterase [Nevskiaceae bacterium]|jgi:diguanylate cyclase (GGDEF)-like protein|nr:bifunctional diguanylate cyclase/phosphodiesterase [Nevskiaceae bacterium]